MKVQEKKSQKHHIRWMLVCYDVLIYLISAILLLVLYGGMDRLTTFSGFRAYKIYPFIRSNVYC